MDLPTILLILAGISFGATVIAILVAFRSSREARTAIFPIVKEEESNRARRAQVSILVWVAITAILLGGWLAARSFTTVGESVVATTESDQPVETAVVDFATPQTADTASATEAAAPSEPAISTPAQAEVATPTPAPPVTTSTPTETPTSVPATATFTSVPRGPAPTGVEIGPIEFSTELGSPIAAINPGTVFAPNRKVYAVYTYRGMENGTAFISVWYLEGVEIARDERPWEWGWQGRSYSFLLPPGEGQYKLELYVNDTLIDSGSFEIR